MGSKHLSEVHQVEKGTDVDGVQGIFALNSDSLRVKVGLGQIAGKRRPNAYHKDDHSNHPGEPATMMPRGLEELRPQVQGHREKGRAITPVRLG